MTSSVSQTYDAMVIAATKAWRYKPATLNGQPVAVGVTLPWKSKSERHFTSEPPAADP